ncbi:glycosyltransferase family 2 protein [Streptomyces sp. ACA25]|uniref:glycosyltransferase family 2 protein n=1 Tax=Streptomyces sp. ACA25 TaxID=3022596 RepID=UPI002308351A|nr:glycosyltransferase family 2 protein [Streptomyces sp. ACA25]MDB1087160.1 glycosyltransferase family 2 protein [Streptomyces sp. ACA25]
MSAHPDFPQHVVTAVLVSHDGARWLPDVLAGLVGQDRPVQDVVAADTGSADNSAALMTEALGAERVLHLARRSGFGTAVAEAARTAPVLTPEELPYLRRPEAWDPETRTWDTSTYDLPELPHGEPVHWLWLLHDDSAPEPDALAELLRHASHDPSAAIIGAKLRGWYDRRQLLEVGVSLANSGRRWTALDRREQDQGQHDHVRAVLAVSTAGMLIRRDVFEQLGGFDRRLPLMRDDVDLCWRAHAAGHRVVVAPGAVLRHAEASARERRTIDCAGRLGASPHRVDKAAAAYTLLVNARARNLLWIMPRLILGTLLRVLAYLVGKMPGRALDEAAGLLATLLRPGRILSARRSRRRTADPSVDPADLRPLFPPRGATVKATVEQVVSNLSGRSEPASSSGGRHGAVESGPADDDAEDFEVEQFVRIKRLARKPGPVLFVLLLLLAFLASRELIGGGALTGGALLPAPADAAALWSRYLETWQPLGTGGTESAPPYLALLALLSTGLLGSTGLALTLLFVCAVPLAGLSAYFASKPLVPSKLLRAWGSAAYAFLPAVTGALASGRIGTVVLAVLLPLLARCAVVAAGLPNGGRGPWRAAWAGALLLTVITAFTPVLWPLALTLALGAVALPPRQDLELRKARAGRLAVLLLTPAVLLSPWSWSVLTSPSAFLTEAGLIFDTAPATASQLLTFSPGGPGALGAWLLTGLLLAALAALLRPDRRQAVITAWGVALVALLFAVWANASHWAGPATLVYGLALLSAAALGADGARHRVATQNFGWRQPVAVGIAAAAAIGPLLAAAGWLLSGAGDPLERRNPVQVPAFVAEESSSQDQARTLILSGRAPAAGDGAPTRLSYTLVRGSGARLGDGDLARQMPEDSSLRTAVAELAAGSGADQTTILADYAVRYVIVQDGTPEELHRVLDTTPGLKRLSQEDGSALWRVERDLARVMLLPAEDDASAAPQPLPAGPVEVRTELPDGPEGRTLRLADTAAPGWWATLDGRPLTPVTVSGWAQGFQLPAGGGQLEVGHDSAGSHTLWVWVQGFLLLVLTVLALPGRRRELDDDLPEPETVAAGTGGRRRAGDRPAPPPPAGPAAETAAPVPVPAQQGWTEEAHHGTDPGPAHRGQPAPPDGQPRLPEQQQESYPYQEGQDQGYGYGDTGYPQETYPQEPYYSDGQGVPQQNYGDWDGQSYTAPYEYPSDYGDGSNQR